MAYARIQNHPYAVPGSTEYDKTQDGPQEIGQFIAISIALTGFSEAELHSTGLTQVYFEELALIVGRDIRTEFLAANHHDPAAALHSAKWAPLARNVIRLWYLGQWKGLPATWAKDEFGGTVPRGYNEFGRDVDRVISPQSYQEGLVWRAIGVNPPGAKQPGFASWVRKIP